MRLLAIIDNTEITKVIVFDSDETLPNGELWKDHWESSGATFYEVSRDIHSLDIAQLDDALKGIKWCKRALTHRGDITSLLLKHDSDYKSIFNDLINSESIKEIK